MERISPKRILNFSQSVYWEILGIFHQEKWINGRKFTKEIASDATEERRMEDDNIVSDFNLEMEICHYHLGIIAMSTLNWTQGQNRTQRFQNSNAFHAYKRNGFVQKQSNSCKVGARLNSFWQSWEEIAQDRWILDSVKWGMSIDFIKVPSQSCLPKTFTLTKEYTKICDQEIENMLKNHCHRIIFSVRRSSR